MSNIMDLSVLKIICLMSNYKGFVYLVSHRGSDYVVKRNHLEEFVALHCCDGAIVINDYVMSQIQFENALQWYKKL